MSLDGLRQHFVEASSPEASPFGDDAVEWDYSRYVRALGLTGMRALADQPHSGCAVLVDRPASWDTVRAQYEQWAASAGWTVLRIPARPTVAIPDPVPYALGMAIAGPESLIMARSGAGTRSAPGRRAWSPGRSIPLVPAERWLIAADRVRRRVRQEIATRGLVLFIEEAHKITAATMSLIGYLLNAHRAWRARMLSQDARLYVVLATTPDHDADLLALLDRHGIKPEVATRRPGDANPAPPPPPLHVEDEHLVAALAAAPLALAESDVRGIFGSSAVDRVRDLAERGVLCRGTEGRDLCYRVSPAYLEGLPASEPRVLAAILECYRDRIRRRRGHQHLLPAMALLAFELGRPVHAIAHFARIPPANDAIVPMDAATRLHGHLEKHAAALHCRHYATWLGMSAHRCEYERAQKLAKELTQRELRSGHDLHRTVTHILCAGRTHLDRSLPDGFWPSVNSTRLDGSLLDAVCILADLFARMRLMSDREIQERYEVVADSYARSTEGQCGAGTASAILSRLIKAIDHRVRLHIEERVAPEPPLLAAGEGLGYCLEGDIPAYVSGSLLYAASMCSRLADTSKAECGYAVDFLRTTGNPHDHGIQLAGCFWRLAQRSYTLLLRPLADDLVLLLPRDAPRELRRRLCVRLQRLAGRRTWMVSASSLLFRERPGVRRSHEAVWLSRSLVERGDFSGAQDALCAALGERCDGAYPLALVIQTQAELARRTLAWDDLDVAEALAERWHRTLPAPLVRHLRDFIQGSRNLCASNLEEALQLFERARVILEPPMQGEARALWATALESELMTHRLLHGRTGTRGGQRDDTALERLAALLRSRAGSTRGPLGALGNPVLGNLEYVALALEAWAQERCARSGEQAVDVCLFVRGLVDGALRSRGDDLISALVRVAPRFFSLLCAGLSERVGYLLEGAPSTRAVHSALELVSEVWQVSLESRERRAMEQLTSSAVPPLRFTQGSHARTAKRHLRYWCDDAATYALLRNQPRCHSSHSRLLRVFGYVGVAEVPKQMCLKAEWSRHRKGWCVEIGVAPESAATSGESRRPLKTARAGSASKKHRIAQRFRGSSAAAENVRRQAAAAARCDYPVLLLGETGVGKEVVARDIHAASVRAANPLVVVDCAAAAQSLLESELFGHEKGAFTGATEKHAGYFAAADKSTLLLDEVDSMSARMQAALLRVLEAKEYRPLGGTRYVQSDFRLLAAALPRLLSAVDEGAFREDLYYRMSVLCIRIPPLREREGDAIELAVGLAHELGLRLSGGATRVIDSCRWPGNVRQLRHCIQVSGLASRDGMIGHTAIEEALGAVEIPGPTQWTTARIDATSGAWQRVADRFREAEFNAIEFAAAAAMSRRSAQRHLALLLRQGRIVRVGAGRATKYQVAPPEFRSPRGDL